MGGHHRGALYQAPAMPPYWAWTVARTAAAEPPPATTPHSVLHGYRTRQRALLLWELALVWAALVWWRERSVRVQIPVGLKGKAAIVG